MTDASLEHLAQRLVDIPRSITGEGVRETLRVIDEIMPMQIHEVPSGEKVLDWVVPDEWNTTQAWIRGPSGETIVDYATDPLSLVGYSPPMHTTMTLDELRPHLHSVPDAPQAVPFRTDPWNGSWGFCLKHEQLTALADGMYEVMIDTSLESGSLTYGEVFVPGTSSDEVLLSVITCHPFLANEGVSGMVVATEVARRYSASQHRVGLRVLYAPGTIGSITWLARNRDSLDNIVAGMTVVSIGDSRPLSYKRTIFGDRLIDKAAEFVVERRGGASFDFFPFGYDERQFNSPGFRLPVGSIMRARHGEYAEYHTSFDAIDLIHESDLADASDAIMSIIDVIDRNDVFINEEPYGEPHLGRRQLYDAVGRAPIPAQSTFAVLWVLSLSDGDHDLIDIATRSGFAFDSIAHAAEELEASGLISRRGAQPSSTVRLADT